MKKLLLAWLLGGMAGWCEPLTPKALIEAARPGDCQLSPDGRWLAMGVGNANWGQNRVDSELQIFRLGDRAPMWKMPRGGRLRWAPDSHQFLYHLEGNLYVCSVDDWRPRRLTRQGETQTGVWSWDSRSIAYVRPDRPRVGGDSGRLYDDLFARRWNRYHDGRQLHLWVTDLQGNSRDVTERWARDAFPTSGTFSSGDNFCFSADNSALLAAVPPARGQASDTNYDVWRIPLSGEAANNLTEDNPAADLGPRLDPQQGKLYVVSASRPGYESDFQRLRSRPLDPSGRPQGAWVEEKLGEGDGLGELSVRAGEILYTRSLGARTVAFRRDPQGKIQELGPYHGLTRCDKQWAGIRDGLAAPPQVVLGDFAGNPLLEIGEPPSWTLGTVESLEVPVEGASMQMWLIKPPNYDPGKRWPLVYMIHGGPQGGWGDSWSVRWNPQVWAAQGYLVAMPNPRGSSGRGRLYQEQVSRDWGGLAYRDLMTGLDHLTARSDVDSRRLAAVGASYGGYMVNWLAVHSDRFRALVTHCGVWNLESMYGTTDELWFADWEFGGPPWGPNRPADYDQFSPHRRADQLAAHPTPHLVIHNDLDYRCPIDQGLQLFTALQRQGVPSRFLNFPDEGHWVLKPANSLRWHLEIFAFLDHYCRQAQP